MGDITDGFMGNEDLLQQLWNADTENGITRWKWRRMVLQSICWINQWIASPAATTMALPAQHRHSTAI